VTVPQFPVYLFDVDGTLVDSAADICGAIQVVLRHTSQNAVPDAYLRRFIGRHLVDLYAELFPDYTAEQLDAMVQEYRIIYPLRNHASTFAYPGVVETLKKLGGRKATATTKGTPTTRIVLERFGMLPYFDHVQGTDGFPAKPAPDVIFHALAGLGARVEDCLFVGDSPADMEAARAAGVKCCAATYGYGQREDLAAWSPDYWLEEFGALVG
jgi:HAD superfamily hydrolase (TIGR01549 family)